ncbi:hypothetical protein [Herbaspirillum sp. CF444]|uniref:hypothetical protein n=1 Tax=Herbaspirillum sp. CF444 TaxID=1144319 RepID=UPI0012FA15DD|nr:hypothetical protein [Herbaspirillum sp. CF444]
MKNDEIVEGIEINLHDAEVVSVSVKRLEKEALIYLRAEDDAVYLLRLTALKAFRCEDFVMQNVINRVRQSIFGDISLNDFDYWISWVTSVSDDKPWANSKTRSSWISDLSKKKINLLVLEPSVGASIVAICEKVFFEKCSFLL